MFQGLPEQNDLSGSSISIMKGMNGFESGMKCCQILQGRFKISRDSQISLAISASTASCGDAAKPPTVLVQILYSPAGLLLMQSSQTLDLS